MATDVPQDLDGSTGEFLGHIRSLARARNTQALLNELQTERMDRDVPLKAAVARALGGIGDPAALDALSTLVEHPSSDVRIQAVKALGAIGDKRASAVLATALTDADEMVGWWAVMSLKEIGGAPAGHAMLNALRSPYIDVRKEAVRATRALARGADVSDILCRALQDQSRSVSRASLWRLVRIGDSRALECLGAFRKRPAPLPDRLLARWAYRSATRRSRAAR